MWSSEAGYEHGAARRDVHYWGKGGLEVKLTNLIQLHQKVLGTLLIEQRLGSFAIGAVGLGENDDVILVDDLLGLRLCGRHGGG
jgi:hypothetical protein